MKKIILALFIGMFLISLASFNVQADIKLDSGKQGECISLQQTCDTCTWVNVSSVTRTGQNSTTWNINGAMTKFGVDYNYSFCQTDILGDYVYSVYGNKGGGADIKSETGYFAITPSGKGGTENIVFFILVIIIIYGFTFISFFYARNIPLTVLGGMIMMFLGIYMINEGIIIFRDTLTNYISYVTIGAGAIMAIWALLEQFEVI